MTQIAVLGLGAMGTRMAERLLAGGHSLTVWNRSPARAEALIAQGAKGAATPAAAVARCEVALSMLRDDEAAHRVWLAGADAALPALPPAAIAIESSTLSLAGIHTLAAAFAAAGRRLLEAPVAGSRPQAEAGTLIHLVGGEAEVLARVRPLLALLGQTVHHLGPHGAGAALKLAVNSLFGVQAVALAEVLALMRRAGLDPAAGLALIAGTPVCSPAAAVLGKAMLAGAFDPLFPVELVEKDFGYALAAGGELPLIQATRARLAEAIAQGLGEAHLSAVVQLYTP